MYTKIDAKQPRGVGTVTVQHEITLDNLDVDNNEELSVDYLDFVTHGVDCCKIKHGDQDYRHNAGYDGAYVVFGLTFCGRCHREL